MRTSLPKRINPFLLAPLLIGKKVVVWAFIEAGGKYGWNRVYRRLTESAHIYIENPEQRKRVQALIKQSIIIPGKSINLVMNSEAVAFAGKILDNAKSDPRLREHAKFFDFLIPLLEAFAKRTGLGSSWRLFDTIGKGATKGR
jgi:hypothetical protein